MEMLAPTSRVAVIGGGVIGCMTAYYLTRAGVRDIVVVERDHVASGASGFSAGILTPYSGSNDPGLLALSAATLELHAELAEGLPEATGIDYGYDVKPYLRCGFREPGVAAAREFMDARIAEGFDAEFVSGDEARELCDWLSIDVAAACLTYIEPTVDSRLLTQAALKAAEQLGARLQLGNATGLFSANGGNKTVNLADGSVVEADVVVLAMGPWTSFSGDWLGYDIPVYPQKGELLYTHLPNELAGRREQGRPPASMHNMDDGGVILTRRISRTVLGATKEDGVGFNREPSNLAWQFILPRVQRLSDRISAASVTDHTACLRPTPIDGKPYVGPAPGWDGVYIAAGHWSEGIHYAPLTGKIIADLITAGDSDIDYSAIQAQRMVDH